MATNIDIVNRALTKLGGARIISLDDDNEAARAAKSLYDTVRQDELRAHVWSFSKKRALLAASTDAPLFGYAYQYPLPADCVRILEIDEGGQGIDLSDYRGYGRPDYSLEGRAILTDNSAPLKLLYCADITETTLYDASFVETFACRLAAELCEPLTQSNTKREGAWKEYRRSLISAANANACELPSQPQTDDTWILGRL